VEGLKRAYEAVRPHNEGLCAFDSAGLAHVVKAHLFEDGPEALNAGPRIIELVSFGLGVEVECVKSE
jgi:hypothetical protein